MKEAEANDKIEKLLELSTASWSGIPEIVAELDTWDLASRQSYLAEGPLEEDRLAQLARYAAGGQMDDAQMARYRELLRLVRETDRCSIGSSLAWSASEGRQTKFD